MVGLLVVEFCEKLGGKGGVFANGSGGGGSMAGGCWGVVGGVRVLRHALSVESAEGVPAEGGVGVLVLKGLSLLFVLLALRLLPEGWWLEGVVVQVPCRWG